jgi:hypothetical protein
MRPVLRVGGESAEFAASKTPSHLDTSAVDPAEKRRRARAQADEIADKQNLFGSGRPDGVKRRPQRPTGNARQALLRRLRRDHPELHRLVLAGTLSPFRAAVAAGFRKKPGPRPRPIDPLEEGHPDVLLELWLGPGHHGSLFDTRAQLQAAWNRHKDEVLRLWGSHCRRPQGWWEFEAGDLERPDDYDDEPAFLLKHGMLSEAECAEFEANERKKEPSNAIAEGPESA